MEVFTFHGRDDRIPATKAECYNATLPAASFMDQSDHHTRATCADRYAAAVNVDIVQAKRSSLATPTAVAGASLGHCGSILLVARARKLIIGVKPRDFGLRFIWTQNERWSLFSCTSIVTPAAAGIRSRK